VYIIADIIDSAEAAWQVLFVIASPEVYKSPNSDCYIVFGEAKVEDMNQQAQMAAAQQQMAQQQGGRVPALEKSGVTADDDDEVPELEPVEEEGEVDETGVEPKDIELVIQQVGCSRAKAVKALKESGGDLINASECSEDVLSDLGTHISLQSWLLANEQCSVFVSFLAKYCTFCIHRREA
jgi:NACalpha-BTF3-like transcription factor